MKFLINILTGFFNLLYPKICMSCSAHLVKNEEIICTKCLFELPRTNFHTEKDNPISQLFWGKIDINIATAFYHFKKGSKFQDLIHRLKYHGKKEIGYALGKQLGYELKNSEFLKDVDYVIPVPLHPKKEKKRGYNQSDWIAFGIAEILGIEADTKSVFRKVQTETQTKKNRMERWKNVESIFGIKDYKKFENKHVLIVDDVITTGATIEACAQVLKEKCNIKISIAALAVAS
ncbi:MAG: ComF family protein [Bacteroidota bacterium]